jgi:hypothetical protein
MGFEPTPVWLLRPLFLPIGQQCQLSLFRNYYFRLKHLELLALLSRIRSWNRRDSNPHTLDCKSSTQPLSYCPYCEFFRFLSIVSPKKTLKRLLVESKGLEPSVLCVQGRCFSQLSHDPKK